MSEAGEMGDTNGERRARLEQHAEVVRSRLSRRLDALDERREHIVELAKKATRPPVSIVLLGTATVVGALIVAHQLRKHRPSRSQRFGEAMFGVPPKPEGFLVGALKRAALAFVATLVQRVSTRGLDRLLPEAPPTLPGVTSPGLTSPEVPRPRAY
jgi:hypothetical protein